MNFLGQLIGQEIGLSLRSKRYWLLGFLAVVATFIPSITLLLLQFMVIATVTRERRTGFSGILASLPDQTAQLSLARALATFCLLLGLWPFMLLTVGFLPGLEPAAWLFNVRDLAAASFHYLVYCMAAVGFVFFSSLWTKRAGRLYLISGLAWLVGMYLASNTTLYPYWSNFLILSNRAIRFMAPGTALGYFPEPDVFPALTIFHVAVSVLLWALATMGEIVKRGEWLTCPKTLLGLILTMMLLGITTGVTVWRGLHQRGDQFRLVGQETDRLQRIITRSKMKTAPVWEACDLQIKLHSVTHRLEGKAKLSLRLEKSTDCVFFTLRNYLTVESVTLAGVSQRLQWRRDGSVLAVRLPEHYQRGDKFTLAIRYSGSVWEWATGELTRPSGALNFVTSAFSLLRSGHAWYPVPGVQPLSKRLPYVALDGRTTGETIWAARASHPAVRFHLTVDSDTDNQIVTNLERTGVEPLTGPYKKRYRFNSPRGRDVYLLAGPYDYQKRAMPDGVGFMEVYSYPRHQSRVTAVLNSLTKPYRYYQELFQQPESVRSGKTCTVLELPALAFLAGNEEFGRDLSLTDTILISEDLFQAGKWRLAAAAMMQDNKRSMAVLQRWLQEDLTVGGSYYNGSICEGLMLYLFALQAADNGGREFFDSIKLNLQAGKGADSGEFYLPRMASGPVIRDVFLLFEAMRAADSGTVVLKQVTQRLYAVYIQKRTISASDFAGVIQTVLAGTDWPSRQTELIRQYLRNIAKHDSPENRGLKQGIQVTLFPFRPEEWLP